MKTKSDLKVEIENISRIATIKRYSSILKNFKELKRKEK